MKDYVRPFYAQEKEHAKYKVGMSTKGRNSEEKKVLASVPSSCPGQAAVVKAEGPWGERDTVRFLPEENVKYCSGL